MFVGPGDNGKSTLLQVLSELLGSDAIATETFQTLTDNRFAAARLWDKLANICADIPASAVRYTGTFKMLTGGDLLRGEHKFREAFDFRNPAKLIFSANELPQVNDKTFAFWRRWILIAFTEDFAGREDRDLAEKLRSELPGILNWALEGLRELRTARGFDVDGIADALKEEWKRRADSLYWFVSECVGPSTYGWVSTSDFYRLYAEFAEANGASAKTKDSVGKELPNLIPQARKTRGSGEGRPWGWSGLEISRAYLDSLGQNGQLGQRTDGNGGYVQAVPGVQGSLDTVPVTSDEIARSLRTAIHALDQGAGRGAEESLIVADLEAEKVPRETTLAWLKRWRDEGTIFCPRFGFYRLTDGSP